MSVNLDIWGPLIEDNTWKSVFGDSCRLTQTVHDTLSTGNSKREPLDNSVCIFGFGLNSPFQNTEFVSWDYDNQQLVSVKPFRNTVIPWALGSTAGLTNGTGSIESPLPPYTYVWGNVFRWVTPYPDNEDYDQYLGEQITVNRYITDFDYQKKYLVIIEAVCTNTHTSGGTTYTEGARTAWITLPNWFSNYKSNYDAIGRIALIPTSYQALGGDGYFSLFTQIQNDINIVYSQSDPRYNQQLLPGNWYAYRLNGLGYLTYDGAGNYAPFGFVIAGGYYYNTAETARAYWMPFFKPTVGNWQVYDRLTNGVWSSRYSAYLPGSKTNDEIYDDIAHIVAHMGCFFTFDRDKINADNDDYDVFLGLLSDGISTGNYTRGEDNRNSEQFTWGSPTDAGFDPASIADSLIIDNDGSKLQVPLFASFSGYYYIMGGARFQEVWKYINDNFHNEYEELQNRIDFWKTKYDDDPMSDDVTIAQKAVEWAKERIDCLQGVTKGIGQDPNTAIKSILCFPFDLTPYIATETGYFKWGYNTVQGLPDNTFNRVTGSTSQFWVSGGSLDTTLGTGTYVGKTRSFLDYAPYTTSQLYIPYCGCVNIDPDIYVGKTLNVRYLVDWITGACTALVYANSDIIDQISGQMAVTVSLSNLDTVNYMNSVFQGNQSFKLAKSGLVNSIGGAFSALGGQEPSSFGAMISAASSIANAEVSLEQANYDLATVPVNFKQIMQGSSFISTGLDQRVRLYVYRPIKLDGSDIKYNTSWGSYGHTTGHACIINSTISDARISGYCVANIDTSGIAATATEKDMIKSLLASGVYV